MSLDWLSFMGTLPWYDYCGYFGMVLAMCSLWMRTMIPLRAFAIAAGSFFMTYSFFHGAWPNFIINVIALPIQVWRLFEMLALTRRVRDAASGDLSIDWLKPYMHPRTLPAGQVLFRQGDPAVSMFYVNSGRLRLPELNCEVGAGEVVGEMALFSPTRERTATVIAATDCELLEISDSSLKQLYYQNPQFGFFLIQLITRRMCDNLDRLRKSHPVIAAKAA